MALTALVFVLVYFSGLAFALAVRPIYGLYTYIAVFYLHPPSRWWGAAIPDLRWSLLAAAVTLFALLINRDSASSTQPKHRSTIVTIFFLYVIWMWIQWPWVPSYFHKEGVLLFSKYLVLMYLITTILRTEKDFVGFCAAHVIGCAYLGWIVFGAPDVGRLEGVGGPGINNANTLGMHLASGLVIASFLMIAFKDWWRWVMLASIPFIANGVIQTETRGAIVGLVLGGLVTMYLKPRKYRRLYYFLAVLAVCGVIGFAHETFIQRISTLTAVSNESSEWDDSASSRIVIAKAQFSMFADHPLGVGHQGTRYLSRAYIDQDWLANTGDRASHNTVMSVLVDQGAPGLVLLIILLVTVLRILKKLKSFDSIGLSDELGLYRAMIGGSLAVIFGAGMFSQNLKAEVLIWNLALLAVLWGLGKQGTMKGRSLVSN